MQSGDLRKGGGHVPPGHELGPQSRRSKHGKPIGIGICVLVLLGFVGAAVFLLITAKHAKSPSGARIGAAILGGAGILMLLLLMYIIHKLRPRQARYMELRVEPIEVRRGGTVSATVTISDAAKVGEKLSLGLVCTEYYDLKQAVADQNGGTHDQRVIRTVDAFEKWEQPDRQQLQQTLRFTVPVEAPFSYEGGTVSWAWHVSLIDRHHHRTDAHREVPIWVSP